MAVNGTKREVKEYVKKIGLAQLQIIGVNPKDNEQVKEWGFYVYDENREPEYSKTLDDDVELKDKDNNVFDTIKNVKQVSIVFYLKSLDGSIRRQKTFYLQNFDLRSRNNPENYCFINEQGETTYVPDEASVPDWLKETRDKDGNVIATYKVRKAKKGEPELYKFLRAAYNLEWSNGDTCLLDITKLFKENFTELKGDVAASADTVICPLTIRKKKIDGDEGESYKEVEDIFNAFAPGDEYRFIASKKVFTEKDVQAIADRKAHNSRQAKLPKDVKKSYQPKLKDYEKMLLDITDSQYGCTAIYFLGVVKDYNAEDFEAGGTNAMIPAGEEFDGNDEL